MIAMIVLSLAFASTYATSEGSIKGLTKDLELSEAKDRIWQWKENGKWHTYDQLKCTFLNLQGEANFYNSKNQRRKVTQINDVGTVDQGNTDENSSVTWKEFTPLHSGDANLALPMFEVRCPTKFDLLEDAYRPVWTQEQNRKRGTKSDEYAEFVKNYRASQVAKGRAKA